MKFDTSAKFVQSHKADAWAAAANLSAAIAIAGFDTARIILNAGTCTATGTLNVKVQWCATSGGTYSDISGAAFAEITTANDEAVYVGVVHLNELSPGFIKILATGGTDACDHGIIVEMFNEGDSKDITTTLSFNT